MTSRFLVMPLEDVGPEEVVGAAVVFALDVTVGAEVVFAPDVAVGAAVVVAEAEVVAGVAEEAAGAKVVALF